MSFVDMDAVPVPRGPSPVTLAGAGANNHDDTGITRSPGSSWTWSPNETGLNGNDMWENNQTIIPMGSLVSLNYNLPSMILVASILFVVIVATAFGNFLVALALFRYRYLRTISNYLIGNLAISDFLLATTILPLSTVNECLGHWVFGQVMCNFWLLTDVLYCTASIWNLCIIAFDRFTATLYPLWYREKRSTKLAAIYVAIVWIISAAICMPPLLGWNELSQNYKYDNTTNVYRCMLFETPSYVAYSASGSFYIPFFITFFMYIRIFTVLHKRMKKMRNASKQHQARLQQHANNTKPLLSNNVSKTLDKELAINTITTEGSGNTEELSSKSLFGSDSGEEDEIEESSTQTKSDHAFVPNHNASEQRTGSKSKRNGAVDLSRKVVVQSHLCDSDHDSASDTERVRALEVNCVESQTGSGQRAEAKTADPASSQALLSKNGVNKSKTDKDTTSPAKKSGRLALFKKQPKKKKIPSSQKRKYEQREMRATIRMAIIIAFFCGMWLGFFTTYFIRGFCSHCTMPRELDAFFFWLGYSNSSVNPILYTIFNEEFRKAFQKILGCYRKGAHQHGRR